MVTPTTTRPGDAMDVTSTGFTFQRPVGGVAGKAYVQALNPPYVPVTSTGNDPQRAFDLQ